TESARNSKSILRSGEVKDSKLKGLNVYLLVFSNKDEEIAKTDKVMYFIKLLKNVTKIEVNYHVSENLDSAIKLAVSYNSVMYEIKTKNSYTLGRNIKTTEQEKEDNEILLKSKEKDNRICKNFLKIEEKIQSQNALILIDSEASKDFIDEKFSKKIQLKMKEESTSITIELVNDS
ncbi:12053_t:CDS:2, partial [Cetraspora pellucida]